MYTVRQLRTEKGWNQNELAFHADLAPSVISQIETGKREPSATTLRKLADALGVDIPDLFERDDSPKREAPSPPEVSDEERRVTELERWIEYIERRARAWGQQAAVEENPFLIDPKTALQWESEVSKEVLEISEAAEKAARALMEENTDGATAAQELQKLEDAYTRLWEASRLVTSRANAVVVGAGRETLEKAAEAREREFEAFQEWLNTEAARSS